MIFLSYELPELDPDRMVNITRADLAVLRFHRRQKHSLLIGRPKLSF